VDERRRLAFEDCDRQHLEEQRRRVRVVPIEDRLREVIAWSAALLADHLARMDAAHRRTDPDPVGLGSRRP